MWSSTQKTARACTDGISSIPPRGLMCSTATATAKTSRIWESTWTDSARSTACRFSLTIIVDTARVMESRTSQASCVTGERPSAAWPSGPELPPSKLSTGGVRSAAPWPCNWRRTSAARGIILERTFTSLPDVAARHYPWLPVRRLMRNQFNSLARIGEFRGPLLQSHGTHDEIVPFVLGKQLFDAAASERKQFVPMPGVTHNGPNTKDYYTELHLFFEQLR